MELSERKKKILAAVVEDYIETAEPIGSKAIARKPGVSFSSATIRSEMAELTSLGYLEQPHTSAGRIPSPQGYRLYVNELMGRYRLSTEETERINRALLQRLQQLDLLIADVGQIVAQLTRYPALALTAPARVTIIRFDLIYIDVNTFIIVAMLSNNTVKNKLVHLTISVPPETVLKMNTVFNAHFTGISLEDINSRLIGSIELAAGDTAGIVASIAGFAIEILTEANTGRAAVAGASQILELPEFRDPDKAQRLLSFLSDSDRLLELPPPPDGSDVNVLIGPENLAEELQDSSVVFASFGAEDGVQGMVGVVGPTRMDYAKVASRLGYLAQGLSKLFRGEYNAGD